MSNNQKIIKKVKGLLALANDTPNDEESQAAFLLAQKLMIKHNVRQDEVDQLVASPVDQINGVPVTSYKTLYWWEKKLAEIISKNFRVKYYVTLSYKETINVRKRIMFYGLDSDLELAREMYILAYEVLLFHSKRYIEASYHASGERRQRYLTESIKISYISGFLSGLEERFAQQVAALRKEYSLMVLIPKEVQEAYAEFSIDFVSHPYHMPNASIDAAYSQGAKDGQAVDFTHSTVGTGA